MIIPEHKHLSWHSHAPDGALKYFNILPDVFSMIISLLFMENYDGILEDLKISKCSF